jgi:hypothetical protein
MSKYYLHPTLIQLLDLSVNKKYSESEILQQIKSKDLSKSLVVNMYKDYRDCGCNNPNCILDSNKFIKYIMTNLIIDDGTPDCNFYYSYNMIPAAIDIENFKVV